MKVAPPYRAGLGRSSAGIRLLRKSRLRLDAESPRGDADAKIAPHRKHYADLDFLRGVAAAIVVLFHLGDHTNLPALAPHGFFGVDLFFCMSGFVLAHSYGSGLRDHSLTPARFLLIRALRLGPMILLGAIVGTVVECLDDKNNSVIMNVTLMWTFIKTCFLIPTISIDNLGPGIFPINGPFWSLFFEFVANVAFAILVYFASRKMALWTFFVAICGLYLGMFLVRTGTLNQSGVTFDQFWSGFPRVGFSFCIGLAIYRYRHLWERLRSWKFAPSIALVVLCFVPTLSYPWEITLNIVAVALIVPAIVVASTVGRPVSRETPIVRWAGLISYPLYAVHYPIVRIIGVVIRAHTTAGYMRLAAVAVSLFGLLLMAGLIEHFIDHPIRRRLRSRV